MAPWCLFCIPRREASAESLDGAPAPRMPAHTSMRAHLSPPPLCIQRRAPPCRKALDPGDGRRDGLARPRLTRLVEAWWGGGGVCGGMRERLRCGRAAGEVEDGRAGGRDAGRPPIPCAPSATLFGSLSLAVAFALRGRRRRQVKTASNAPHACGKAQVGRLHGLTRCNGTQEGKMWRHRSSWRPVVVVWMAMRRNSLHPRMASHAASNVTTPVKLGGPAGL